MTGMPRNGCNSNRSLSPEMIRHTALSLLFNSTIVIRINPILKYKLFDNLFIKPHHFYAYPIKYKQNFNRL
jgi:hypothetical protein